MLRLLGWIMLSFVVILGSSIAIPTFARGDPIPQRALLGLGCATLASAIYLAVGSGVKRHHQLSKSIAVVLALLALLFVPIGTVIGGFALYYLVRGWHEKPSVA